MSSTQQPISEYVKQGVFIIAILAICLFGVKTCRKYQQKKQVVIELTSNASESAAYEQFYQENAEQNLLKAMFQIRAGVELGMTPAELLAKVMQQEEAELFSTEEAAKLPIRKVLIQDALLSNYDNCLKLGIFDNQLNMNALSSGEKPVITKGPAEGEDIIIQQIIPANVLPGADKLLPNLAISPPATKSKKKKTTAPTDFEIARAKRLAQQLANADLIEKDAYKKVISYYDQQVKKPLAEDSQPVEKK